MNTLQLILDEVLIDIENINNEIYNDTSIEDINKSFNKVKKYDIELKKINKTINTILSIQNNIKVVFTNIVLKRSNKFKSLNSTLKENNIKNKESVSYNNLTNLDKYKNLDYMKCPVITTSSKNIQDIINTPIYYLEDTKEYAIKINNNIIKGNIGNILEPKDSKAKIKTHKCNKNNCNEKFYKKDCKYIHDNEVKNYPYYSWSHIKKNKLCSIKYDLENSRFISSLDTLSEDLSYTSLYEKELRNNQLMHDILLYQILSKYLD